MNYEDYDDYTEPQPAEISGPVGTTRTRKRQVATRFAPVFSNAFISSFSALQPPKTGPPKVS